MNILYVIDYYHPNIGGGEIVFQNVAERLAEQGHEVTVITSRVTGTSRHEVVNGVAVYRPWIESRFDRYLFALSGIPAAVRAARRADVVHTSIFTSCLPAFKAKMFHGKPLVTTIHEVFDELWHDLGMGATSATAHRFAEKCIISLPYDHIISVSQYTKDRLVRAGVPADRVTAIYNGLEDAFTPRDVSGLRHELGLDGPTVLYFGRPGVTKGTEYLIRALPLINNDATFVFMMTKKPQDEYERCVHMIRKLDLDDRVRLIPSQPRGGVPDYISLGDVVVVPSISEGFGFCAAEASALGRPVVASRAGSLPEVIKDGVTGILVEPRNPRAIAEAVNRLLDDPALAGRMGASGVEYTARFTWDEAVKRYLEVYERLTE